MVFKAGQQSWYYEQSGLVPCTCHLCGGCIGQCFVICSLLPQDYIYQYLSGRTLYSRRLFLLAALVKWREKTFMKLYTRDGWCQTIVFIKYVCTVLRVWYVVGFTSERYIAVHFPLRHSHLCTARRAKMRVVTLAVGAMVLYGAVFWFYGTQKMHYLHICAPYDQYTDLVTTYLHNFNTVIMFIIPFCLITVMNVRIAVKVLICKRETMRRTNWEGIVTRQTYTRRDREVSVVLTDVQLLMVLVVHTVPDPRVIPVMMIPMASYQN